MSMKHVIIIIISLLVSKSAMGITLERKDVRVIRAIVKAADTVKVPRELLLALCWNESSFRTDSKITHMDGGSLSHGICQVKLLTARDMDWIYHDKVRATEEMLEDPFTNALYAAKYLRIELKRYNGNWEKGIDAYNKGSAVNVNSSYVKKVMGHYKQALVELPSKVKMFKIRDKK
jgi:soluble lytic murein transglycosylase-like protein